MDAIETAVATAGPVGSVPAQFMMDGATYAHGGSLGFDGVDFYFAGRGGALGDVSGAVVAAAFVFFNPKTVDEAWERARKVRPAHEAAQAFARCAATWAEAHLPDGVDYRRLAELEARVISSASPAPPGLTWTSPRGTRPWRFTE